MQKEKILKVVVLGRNAGGEPCFHVSDVAVTDGEYAKGVHYERAIEDAEAQGFESPFEAFDENDEAARQMFGVAMRLGADPVAPIRAELATVVDMARSHIDDIESGVEEGIYDRAENADAPQKREAVEAIERFYHASSSGSAQAHYLLIMVGDVEPELSGPYRSDEEVLQAARNHRIDDPEMADGLFSVTVTGSQVSVDAFSGAALELDEEDA